MPLFVSPSTLGSATIVTNSASAVGLTITGAVGQTADMLDIDLSHSTDTYPATIGFTGNASGVAGRIGVIGPGVLYDGLQMGNAQSTQLVGYYGLVLQGNAQPTTGPAFFGALGDRAVHIPITNATDIGLVIKGAASQSGDLQQWQNSGGGVVASVSVNGNIFTVGNVTLNAIVDSGGSGSVIQPQANNAVLLFGRTTSVPVFEVRGAASQTADLQQWQSSTGSVLASVRNDGAMQSTYFQAVGNTTGGYIIASPTNPLLIQAPDGGHTPLVIKASTSPSTSDLLQFQSPTLAVLAKVDASGNFTTAGGVTTAYASKAANYTMTASDSVIVAAAASLVITLPSAAAVSAGRVYKIKNNNQTTTTIKTSAAGQTIDGTDYSTTGYALNTAYGAVRLVSDGVSAWFTI